MDSNLRMGYHIGHLLCFQLLFLFASFATVEFLNLDLI